jgi:hypothetical protein
MKVNIPIFGAKGAPKMGHPKEERNQNEKEVIEKKSADPLCRVAGRE